MASKQFTISYCGSQKNVIVRDSNAQIVTDIPENLTFDGYGCKTYHLRSTCDWSIMSNDPSITINPPYGVRDVDYDVEICYSKVFSSKVLFEMSGGTSEVFDCDNDFLDSFAVENRKRSDITINRDNVTAITVGSCVREIGKFMDGNIFSNLKTFTVSEGVETIGVPEAWSYVVRVSSSSEPLIIYLPSTLTTMGAHSIVYYYQDNGAPPIVKFAQGSRLKTIYGNNFYEFWRTPQYALDSFTIPDSVEVIEHLSFADNTYLKSINIPNNLRVLGTRVFSQLGVNVQRDANDPMRHITFPATLESIGNEVFRYCTYIEDFTFLSTTPPTLNGDFSTLGLSAIYVPAASVDAYKAASGWSTHANIIQAIQ